MRYLSPGGSNLPFSTYAATFSPDGKTLVTSGESDSNTVWSFPKGEVKSHLDGTATGGLSINISPDGHTLVTGASAITDGKIKVWNLRTGKVLHTLPGSKQGVSAVAISPDSSVFAFGSNDGTLKILSLRTGEPVKIFRNLGKVWSVAFASDGRTLVSAQEDGTIKIWQVPDSATSQAKSQGIAGYNPVADQPQLPIDIRSGGSEDNGFVFLDLSVPDRHTTKSAFGGALRLYDAHIAKMFEVTDFLCHKNGWSSSTEFNWG